MRKAADNSSSSYAECTSAGLESRLQENMWTILFLTAAKPVKLTTIVLKCGGCVTRPVLLCVGVGLFKEYDVNIRGTKLCCYIILVCVSPRATWACAQRNKTSRQTPSCGERLNNIYLHALKPSGEIFLSPSSGHIYGPQTMISKDSGHQNFFSPKPRSCHEIVVIQGLRTMFVIFPWLCCYHHHQSNIFTWEI